VAQGGCGQASWPRGPHRSSSPSPTHRTADASLPRPGRVVLIRSHGDTIPGSSESADTTMTTAAGEDEGGLQSNLQKTGRGTIGGGRGVCVCVRVCEEEEEKKVTNRGK